MLAALSLVPRQPGAVVSTLPASALPRARPCDLWSRSSREVSSGAHALLSRRWLWRP